MNNDPKPVVEAYKAGRIRRILLIRISRVGDLLFTTPAIRCLKARFPQAEFHFLTNPYSAQVLAGNPHIHRIHLMDRKSLRWRFLRMDRVISELRNAHIDLVIPFRWRKEYRSLFEKINVPFVYRLSEGNSAREPAQHMVEKLLTGLAPLGVTPDERGMEIYYGEKDEADLKDFLVRHRLDGAPLIVLHSGCHQTRKLRRGSSAGKRSWPIEHWAELVKHVHKRNGVPPILTGFSQGDMTQNNLIVKISGVQTPQFTRRSLNCLAALLSRADGFVCGDTGPLHAASAAGVPTVALFGPSNPEVTGPCRNACGAIVLQKNEVDCVPCKGKDVKCRNNICMQKITAQEVYEALCELTDISKSG